MRNGHAFQQVLWVPAINGTDGGALPIGPDGTPGLPTPAACMANDGEQPKTWRARREQIKARWRNGNGMGMPLSIAAQLLPTPTASDSIGSRRETAAKPHWTSHPGTTLTDWTTKLPTPTTRDWKDRQWHPDQSSTPANGMLGREIHAAVDSNQTGAPMYLNPSFVEDMMGFPAGWTA